MMWALPGSASTILKYVLSQLEACKEKVAEMVGESASKVAVSVDVWTTSNYIRFLGVVAHFAGKWTESDQHEQARRKTEANREEARS